MHNKDIERIQQEVVSSNRDRIYQATLKEVQENKKQVPSYDINELKISHHNHMLDMEMKKIKLLLKS